MKKIILPALLLTGWLFFLSSDIPVGDNFLPSIGRFFNPFQGVYRSVNPEEVSFEIESPTKGEVRILFDERDIPHIYANSMEDAIYVQGFLHASNRLFAMDLSTRAAAGRVSELVGGKAINYDHQQREKGFEKLAQQKADAWEINPENKIIIDAYVKGVNAYINSLDYSNWPIEYKILSHPPVTWTPTHTALMATNMAIMLSMAENDLNNTKAKTILSGEDFDYLYPSRNPKESPIISSEKKWDFISAEITSHDNNNELPKIKSKSRDDKKSDINGSNNWAVSGKKTLNGNAILANDPHLNLTLPNIWYEIEIHTPELSVHGASIPGLPYVIIGFNESISWGTTNSGQDVLDWYQITWQDSNRHSYLLDGKYVSAELRVEEIKIRGKRSLSDTIRYTHWGPVMNSGEHKDMAMKWIGHQRATENDLQYLQIINRGKNVADYRKAMEAYQYPAQNKVFASIDDDIAISVAGIMPLRSNDSGAFILKGDRTSYDWQGFIPTAHAPFIINPANGYVSSANQSPVDSTYPYEVIGSRVFEDYRGRMINSILDTMHEVTIDEMKALQQNNYNLHAAELLPLLLDQLNNSNCIESGHQIFATQLRNWNFEQHRDSISPILYEMWYDEFEALLFDELDSMELMHPEDWRIVEIVSENKPGKFFDLLITDTKTETLQDIVCMSFATMVKTYLTLEEDERRNWGTYKATEIPHLARLGPFGVPYMHTSGAKHIINAMGKSHGPSWRMIVEMTSPPKALINYPGGQSGNPASPHYHDMLDQFFEGKYYEVRLRKDPEGWRPVREIKMIPE